MRKIAYLFGAGASAGEMKERGALKGIMMQDIIDGITSGLNEEERLTLEDAANYLAGNADIEQLITLYEASGSAEHDKKARLLKQLFRKELERRVLDSSGDDQTSLFAALLDMHLLEGLDEKLVVVLTTNYEDLFEQAMQAVHGGVNYLIKTVSTNGPYELSDSEVPFLKLHGSFNWKRESPVMIQNTIENEEEVIWIPPGVAKNRENYPFDLIWGKARELLDCDVLRIIGSSLSMNDWELVSLIFTTQKFRTDNHPPYEIEIIDYPSNSKEIKAKHVYLDISTILEIQVVRDHLIREYLPGLVDFSEANEKIDEIAEERLKPPENVFALWLRAKGEALRNDGVPIGTPKGYFEKFVLAGLR